MSICLNDLGDGFITFPDFQRQLRAYESGLAIARTTMRSPNARVDLLVPPNAVSFFKARGFTVVDR